MISYNVANQVAHKLMEVFTKRIPQPQNLEIEEKDRSISIPLLTQDGYSTPTKPEGMSENNNNTPMEMQTDTDTKHSTAETINPTITPNRSLHDNFTERDTMNE